MLPWRFLTKLQGNIVSLEIDYHPPILKIEMSHYLYQLHHCLPHHANELRELPPSRLQNLNDSLYVN